MMRRMAIIVRIAAPKQIEPRCFEMTHHAHTVTTRVPKAKCFFSVTSPVASS